MASCNGEDCCKWKGISCNNLTARVTRLVIQFSYSIPVPGPTSYENFVALGELKLALNELVGLVPHTLANLSNLQTLDLLDNYNLFANDLEWLSHLSNLRYLDLSNVSLSRVVDWPSSISKIPSLMELYLDHCMLPQVNPKSITHLSSSTSLQILSLQENELNSSILSWVLNVSKVLKSLDLASNNLPIQSSQILCQLKDLELLGLDQNSFSGPFLDFSRLSSLKSLTLQNNSISGPLSFGHLPHLEFLDLSFNHLNGSLLIFEVTQFSSLKYLDLSHNQLSIVML
ncbi:hypothetical protein JHK82_052399 [Glycine max]|uniref:Receptor-like protein EIX2 n=1 Tax=Glycine soja TaxID=3848 RepID=A0A445FBY7_GLYSO|nr:hypothetical protein JHK82_052399 [Glycine max]RZB46333.1 Receptor-like protein EIX2 [Glycine soja]